MISTNGYLPIILHYCFPVNNKKRIDLSPIPRYNEKCRGDVPKWLKGPHSKCGRSGNRCEGSNPSISAFCYYAQHLLRQVHCFQKNFCKILHYILTSVPFVCIIATETKHRGLVKWYDRGLQNLWWEFDSLIPCSSTSRKASNQSFPAFCFIQFIKKWEEIHHCDFFPFFIS